jgi:hypothetical protein
MRDENRGVQKTDVNPIRVESPILISIVRDGANVPMQLLLEGFRVSNRKIRQKAAFVRWFILIIIQPF